MRKNVLIPKRILRVFPLGLLSMLVGLTSCNSELNSSIIGCYSAIVQAFGYDMEIVYDGDSTNVPLEVRKLGDDIKAIGAQIVSAPEDVSGSQPGFGCRVNFLVSDLNIPDVQIGDTIDFRIVKYKWHSNVPGPCNVGPTCDCSVKPCI